MRKILLLIISFFSATAYGQISEKEQWRYINLFTSLFTLVDAGGIIYHDSTDSPLTDDELFSKQIDDGLILPDNSSKKVIINLTEIKDSSISGFLINGSKDTLKLILNGGLYEDFTTEVKVNGKWLPFQVNHPTGCGMGIGEGKLFPNYKCRLTLGRSTTGDIKLPFRLKIKIGKQEIVSNAVEISCSQEQFKLIPKKIEDFTW